MSRITPQLANGKSAEITIHEYDSLRLISNLARHHVPNIISHDVTEYSRI